MAHQQTSVAIQEPEKHGKHTQSEGLAKEHSPDSLANIKEKEYDDVDNIKYPEPWKYAKFFIGGYSQGRMIKFKNPGTMYKAINLFAGVAIMFYGYDQGVMSLVNLNPDYWNKSESLALIAET